MFALLLLYVGLSLTSHLLYNIQDVWGLTCRESGDATGLARGFGTPRPDGESKTVEFNTSDLCKPTGILLERNARYHVEVKTTVAWEAAADVTTPCNASTQRWRNTGQASR